ncbi:glycoside hydrolase family 31 [Leadbetterella byssophila DSM 17132]|uniref:Glycoside hydrolase family 31 n=1 Tax=Leadbetterella byssophila (strain DSM 17132 / JCM 16389 / KACC 11308 / NBRC 106382 / 4M15) TaxID=649349 RepID=E4RT70_LEAB4|nr:TIM-barrel domain-containing protein [Leadbetterella byssophila]ADQ18608.1 glycoside hydrolase family 31 [Leadbetterella byssophila DSM 17132]
MKLFRLLFLWISGVSMAQTPQSVLLTLPANPWRPELQLTVEVLNDQTFHVTSFPKKTNVARTENLSVVGKMESVSVSKEEDAQFIKLKTPKATAIIDKVLGAVKFEDAEGRVLLAERPRSSESFEADSYSGDSFYRVKQTFEVSQEEAFYGLGQHQNGVMNYNGGRQVTLLQYNTMIGIPFLYSTKNYGILWHNYSITKAGDIRPLLPLSAFQLYSAEGHKGWLTVNYYAKSSADKVIFTRPESEISYLYLSDQDKLPKEVDLSKSLARYEGKIESPYTGLHRLHFNYSGYLKVWIDGELKEDRWRESWNAGSFELDLQMKQGQKVDLKMEWVPDGGQAYLGLQWQAPLPDELQNTFSFSSEAGDSIDYYFIAGSTGDEVIQGYRKLTGKAQILPKWAFGYWQSRERYKTQAELEQVAEEFRKRRIPIDNLVQDWSYWSEHDWGSHDFDLTRFPDPKGMIEKLHQANYKLMISVWPKINERASPYIEFRDKGWLYLRNIYDKRRDWIGPGYTSTFYDPFHEGARRGFWNLMNEKLYQLGMDAWWMDASEPDIHSNLNIAERKSVFQPAIGSSTRYYNAFPLENARGIFEGQRETDPNKRVVILTRSFFAGQQRYSAIAWSGDISSRWHDMKDQISAGVNFSMSGTPYWTMDAGGFLVERKWHKAEGADLEEWRELNARWFQYGAFLPLFRAHGQFPFREPFHIAPAGHPAYESMVYYIKLRYKLLPYLYSLAGDVYHKDGTFLRALGMEYPNDPQILSVNDQFLLGKYLLVNPVTAKGQISRKVVLPAGNEWYDFYNGSKENGGKIIEAAAPYERIPLFVRAGAILPLGPELQYSDEKPADKISLYVYAGADGSFTLYEDEGKNNEYENGKYAMIPMKYDDQSRTLTIGKRIGEYPGMLKQRQFEVIWVDGRNHKPQIIKYKGEETTLKLK